MQACRYLPPAIFTGGQLLVEAERVFLQPLTERMANT